MLALSLIGKVCITFLFSACMVGFGRVLFGRWMKTLDPFAEVAIAGILGLGTVGLFTLPIGLIPNGLHWGAFVVWGCAAIGAWGLPWKRSIHPFFSRPANQAERIFGLLLATALLLCVGIALVSVITPSVEADWDTLSYHLAVPKLWLKAGQITPISFIHHSNFPFTVDNLYIWGLSWGDQAGAKAFELCYYVFGILAVFGFARQRYGAMAGGWAALAFATIPVILWEAGTGYIDTAHGLYTGLGVLLAVIAMEEHANAPTLQRSHSPTLPLSHTPSVWPLAALCLGFSAGSKYTGLQALIAIALVLGVYILVIPSEAGGSTLHSSRSKRTGIARIAAILAIAVAICSPWYIKNELWVGNPVFPFFYERFGGKNWNQYNADIYRHQQQIFGVPREGTAGGIASLPHAVLGLAYQPGRYTDPSPELVIQNGHATGARGFPFQSLGATLIATALVWLLSGRMRRFEGLLLTWIGVSFLMWFVLSQQSRYAISFAPPLAILLGGGVVGLKPVKNWMLFLAFAVTALILIYAFEYQFASLPLFAVIAIVAGALIVRFRPGPLLAFAVAVQAFFTIWFFGTSFTHTQINALENAEQLDQYLDVYEPFHRAATYLNELKVKRVALFDQTQGFYLDVPYYWANPGHTTEIGYHSLNDGKAFAERLKQIGFNYVYVDVSHDPKPLREKVGASLGFTTSGIGYSPAEAEMLKRDQGQKYKWLLSDAASKGLLIPRRAFSTGFLLELK